MSDLTVESGFTEKIGDTQENKIELLIGEYNEGISNQGTTLAHEIGHSGNLGHPKGSKEVTETSSKINNTATPDNIMIQGGDGQSFNAHQFEKMLNNLKNK